MTTPYTIKDFNMKGLIRLMRVINNVSSIHITQFLDRIFKFKWITIISIIMILHKNVHLVLHVEYKTLQ